ncbi:MULTISPECIES: TraI domain-containing protein [unclassified Caballeronia]|uniref:TraI domain-containing protein n=1 Tax=unclassified Caballeronia TaxID=2646786 RepID=UPI002858A238|nr:MULTISPECIES: TraI domain-containing protein [unclassified Caballeronia]MDR5777103.1 TraI domain-containing protein [Caballeronia sp. LZ002]MDR5798743.1 TraI domain-containing protein [Caballeronia sp. LZ001]MDR5852564.1 TraI domain-containing protein [Caballeronia sp. LZ003]
MGAMHEPIAAEELFATHLKRIELVRQCANESTEAEFARRWLSVLRRTAMWFSSMPLTPELHCEPGGAFRATIESTFYAMRLAGGQKFAADLTSDKRRKLEPQYNYAVFLAAACSLLDEPFRHFEFVRQADQEKWNPAAHGAFGAWIGTKPYAVVRRVAPLRGERMRTALLAQTVITPELLAGLDTAVHSDLFNAINPERSPQGFEALVHKVVRQAMDVAVDFERKAQRAVFAPVKFDVPSAVNVALALEPQFVASQAQPAAGEPPHGAAPAHSAAVAPVAPESGQVPSQDTGMRVDSEQAQAAPTAGPQLSKPLLDALAAAAGQPAANIEATPQRPAAVDPAAARTQTRRNASKSGPTDDELNEILGPGSAMMKEFFKALAGDVASGKAKVVWEEKGLAVQKRLVGAYGMTSDTLVEQLKKRSLLLRAHGNDICIVERAGRLISERPAA